MTHSDQLPMRRTGEGPLDEIFHAIDDEIAASLADPSRAIDVFDGRRLHRSIGGSLYGFRADSPVPFQPETPVTLICGEEEVSGSLVTVEDFDVIVHLRDDLGAEIASARISTRPGFILERLRERLESVVLTPQLPSGGVAGAAWQPDAASTRRNEQAAIEGAKALEAIDDPALHPNKAQWRAMSMAAGSDLHFVWGPPGTGKTAALAQTARMLAGLGERVLVLAHANVAVDIAMLRVADAFAGTDELQASRVLRIGDPHHAEARRRADVLVETAVARRNLTLARTIADLEERRRALAASLRMSDDPVEVDNLAAEMRQVRQELSELRKEYREEASFAIAEAQVVGATLSRFVLSDDVWDWAPDAILLDEASMVSFPWVLLAATRVAKRLVVFGDFRQLPPVFLARTDDARSDGSGPMRLRSPV